VKLLPREQWTFHLEPHGDQPTCLIVGAHEHPSGVRWYFRVDLNVPDLVHVAEGQARRNAEPSRMP
jgi:hypothetical protein